MKMSDVKNMLQAAHQADDSALMIGVHGIGKTEIAKQWAEENDIHMEVLYLSNQEVGDITGIPVVKNNITIWTEPSWLARMHESAFANEFELEDLDFQDKAFEKYVLENINKE